MSTAPASTAPASATTASTPASTAGGRLEQSTDGAPAGPTLEFRTRTDRRTFLRTAAAAGIAVTVVGSGVLATSAAASAGADKAAPSDLELIKFALSVEYLESDFYNALMKVGLTTTKADARRLLTAEDIALLTVIAEHETEHVATVTATLKSLGGVPPAWPKVTYPAHTFATRQSVLHTAWQYEELGVKAYHGMLPLISNPDLLAALASIAGSESRHAAILSTLAHGNPFPAPVEAAASEKTVMSEITPLMVY